MKMPRLGFIYRAKIILLCPVLLFCIATSAYGTEPPPSQYGNILIHRLSEKYGQPWVTFSHWKHRTQFTCRVCHLELGFEMKTNATEITEEANRKGEYCGACHNSTDAFGHTDQNCSKCHNGNIAYGDEKFAELSSLPVARYGNRIDWTAALNDGSIKPKPSLYKERYSPMPFKTVVKLEAKDVNIAPAVFPHESHTQWLDCANCHPDKFNIKQKTTKNLTMKFICEGNFCGTCHRSVAFPVNDCMRCHRDMKQ